MGLFSAERKYRDETNNSKKDPLPNFLVDNSKDNVSKLKNEKIIGRLASLEEFAAKQRYERSLVEEKFVHKKEEASDDITELEDYKQGSLQKKLVSYQQLHGSNFKKTSIFSLIFAVSFLSVFIFLIGFAAAIFLIFQKDGHFDFSSFFVRAIPASISQVQESKTPKNWPNEGDEVVLVPSKDKKNVLQATEKHEQPTSFDIEQKALQLKPEEVSTLQGKF